MENHDPLQSLVDRTQIIDVMNRHATAIDWRRWQDYGSCFTDTFSYKSPFTDGWIEFTRAEMLSAVTALFAQFDATQHLSANHLGELSGKEATCTSVLNATHYVADAPGGPSHQVIGYYDAHLVLTDAWRIDRIELIVFWDQGNSEITTRAYGNINIRKG